MRDESLARTWIVVQRHCSASPHFVVFYTRPLTLLLLVFSHAICICAIRIVSFRIKCIRKSLVSSFLLLHLRLMFAVTICMNSHKQRLSLKLYCRTVQGACKKLAASPTSFKESDVIAWQANIFLKNKCYLWSEESHALFYLGQEKMMRWVAAKSERHLDVPHSFLSSRGAAILHWSCLKSCCMLFLPFLCKIWDKWNQKDFPY